MTDPQNKPVTLQTLQRYKTEGRKFTCLTAYDASFSRAMNQAGIDTILVGDSLGMVIQGHASTLPVQPQDIAYHTACVARTNQRSLLIADMPFLSYAAEQDAISTARLLMQAGAQVIKLEGGAWLAPLVSVLRKNGVPCCVHLGLTPQSVNVFGGYKVQGRDEQSAEQLTEAVKILEAAGTDLFVLECIPRPLAKALTGMTRVPVIGIGAGPETDGQVLVVYDMLGLHDGKPARFVKNFLTDGRSVVQALAAFADAVKNGTFPAAEHCFD